MERKQDRTSPSTKISIHKTTACLVSGHKIHSMLFRTKSIQLDRSCRSSQLLGFSLKTSIHSKYSTITHTWPTVAKVWHTLTFSNTDPILSSRRVRLVQHTSRASPPLVQIGHTEDYQITAPSQWQCIPTTTSSVALLAKRIHSVVLRTHLALPSIKLGHCSTPA